MRKVILLVLMNLVATSCQNADVKQNYPKTAEDRRYEEMGRLTGDEGIVLGGKRKKSDGVGITVNSYLWRASLEAVSELPIHLVDPFSGVIATEWHQTSHDAHERYKLNIIIASDVLRADALRVTAFKQVRKGNTWVDSANSKQLATEIEDRIFTRARQLKIADN
ncbi:MAG: DUF3576 domain-containing protein [Alphaproteobacteria bacterium]|nr:DUF3576 domain-containing protein [Alphaproteobacteria bacterium]OJV15339.1 MAG: hypothetical protein BGO27_02400 [Alphaproteobacteria bacterium 33-17]